MWLTSSSVGRKFVMAVSGAALVLFVTFHCLMNSVAIFWPTAYNAVCEFLGANWYALLASAGLALLIVIHIIYACWLTLQNRAARGSVRYSIETRPKGVEWASKNMLVLGIVVLAFLGVHLVQFWAKMQLMEVLGCEGEYPAAAGTLFLNEAFSCWATPVIYAIGFIALWFHLNHGFWSMFQSVGWDNTTWIPRLKCIGKCWIAIVMLLFFAQLVAFTYNANNGSYLSNQALREQYKEMILTTAQAEVGDDIAPMLEEFKAMPYDMAVAQIGTVTSQIDMMIQQANSPEFKQMAAQYPEAKQQVEQAKQLKPVMERIANFFDYLDPKAEPAQEAVKMQKQSR